MPNHLHGEQSVSVEQPAVDKFFNKNFDVLKKMLLESNEECHIGLPKSNSYQDSVTMRSRLIDWLRQVNSYRHSKPGVLALTVEIIDRFVYMATKGPIVTDISSHNYQLIGATAYHLASKLEEVAPITAYDVSKLTSGCCSPKDITDCEIIYSYNLGFCTKFITPIDFIYHLLTFVDLPDLQKDFLRDNAVNYYIGIIDSYCLKKFPSHIIAINAVMVVCDEVDDADEKQLNMIFEKLINLTNSDRNQLRSCYDIFIRCIDHKKSGDLDTTTSSTDNENNVE